MVQRSTIKQPSIADLTTFLAIVEHMSFRRAAASLGLTPSALSHTIRALERRLNARLFDRTTRSVALTSAGVRLAERLRPAVRDISSAIGELTDRDGPLSGRISINTMEYGGRLLIGHAVGEFQALHRDVDVELCVDDALIDIVAQGHDGGVRFHDQVPPDMVAIPIGPQARMVACASPKYLQGRTSPKTPADLPSHHCIRQRQTSGQVYRWEFEKNGERLDFEPQGSLTCNNIAVIVHAALTGQGIAFVPSHHARQHLETGDLIELLDTYSQPFAGHSLYYPARRQHSRAFVAFIAHVRAMFSGFESRPRQVTNG